MKGVPLSASSVSQSRYIIIIGMRPAFDVVCVITLGRDETETNLLYELIIAGQQNHSCVAALPFVQGNAIALQRRRRHRAPSEPVFPVPMACRSGWLVIVVITMPSSYVFASPQSSAAFDLVWIKVDPSPSPPPSLAHPQDWYINNITHTAANDTTMNTMATSEPLVAFI